MKLKIKIKSLGYTDIPEMINKGEWVDLHAQGKFEINGPSVVKKEIIFNNALIPLGVAMKLPKGFEAIVAPRSSSFKNFGIIQSNSIGIIDGKN